MGTPGLGWPGTDFVSKILWGLRPDVLGDSSFTEEQSGHKWQQLRGPLSESKGLSMHQQSLGPPEAE